MSNKPLGPLGIIIVIIIFIAVHYMIPVDLWVTLLGFVILLAFLIISIKR